MALNPGGNPFALFLGLDGRPLNGGEVYIGIAGQNPITNPQDVFWDEDGNTPAVQPLGTLAGYIVNSGSPARFWTQNNSFSITVLDRFGQQIFYAANVEFALPNGSVTADALPDDPEGLAAITNKLRYKAPWDDSRSRSLDDVFSEFIYLDDFEGADNTGNSDSSAAILAAIDAAISRPASAGAPGSGYYDIILNGIYRVDNQIVIPGEAFIRFIGQGSKYYQSGFLQGFAGDMFTCTSGNMVSAFNNVLFQGKKDVYAGSYSGFATTRDSVHADFRDCTFRDWGGIGLDLANCFDCDFDGLLLPYNKGGGLKITGGASNRLGRICTQNNLGFGIDIACVGSSGGPFFLEGDLIDNDPAGSNLSNRALKIGGSDNFILGGTLLTNVENDKTPVEITGERNAWVAVSSAGKGTATNWVTFGAGANYCRLGGGLQTALTGDAAAIATCLGEISGAYYPLSNGEVLFSKGSASSQAGKGLHAGFDTTNNRAYLRSSDPGTANYPLFLGGSYVRTETGALYLADGMTAPDAISGLAQLFVDTSDGDLKVRFADGTIKLIVVDTP